MVIDFESSFASIDGFLLFVGIKKWHGMSFRRFLFQFSLICYYYTLITFSLCFLNLFLSIFSLLDFLLHFLTLFSLHFLFSTFAFHFSTIFFTSYFICSPSFLSLLCHFTFSLHFLIIPFFTNPILNFLSFFSHCLTNISYHFFFTFSLHFSLNFSTSLFLSTPSLLPPLSQ